MGKKRRVNSRVPKHESLESRNFNKAVGLSNVQQTEAPEILSSEISPHGKNASTNPPHTVSSPMLPYYPNSCWPNCVFPVMPNEPAVTPTYQKLISQYPDVPYHELPPHYLAELPHSSDPSKAPALLPSAVHDSAYQSKVSPLESTMRTSDLTMKEFDSAPQSNGFSVPNSKVSQSLDRSKVSQSLHPSKVKHTGTRSKLPPSVHQSHASNFVQGSKVVQQSKGPTYVQQSKGSNAANSSIVSSSVHQSTISPPDLATKRPDSASKSKAFSSVPDSKVSSLHPLKMTHTVLGSNFENSSKGSKFGNSSKGSKFGNSSKGSNFVNPSKLSSPVTQSAISASNLATKVTDSTHQPNAFSSELDSKESPFVPHSKESSFANPSELSSVPQSAKSTSNLSKKNSNSSSDHSLKRLYRYELRLNAVKPSKHSSKENKPPSSNVMSPQSEVSSCVPTSDAVLTSNLSNNLPPSKKSSSTSSSIAPKSKGMMKAPQSKAPPLESQLKGSNFVPHSEKYPSELLSKGSKPRAPSKLPNSGPRSKASANPSKVTNLNVSSNNPPSKDPISVPSSNELPSEVWTKWKNDSKNSRSKPRQKGSSTVSRSKKQTPQIRRPVVLTFVRPGKNSRKPFADLAKAVYVDILKYHQYPKKSYNRIRSIVFGELYFEESYFEESYLEDQDVDINNAIRKTIYDLFSSKPEFFKTALNDIDLVSTNFYKMFFCWGLSLMSDDLTEEKIYEFIIKVCCCAISVESEYPDWENIMKKNAIQAIADCCVLLFTSKCADLEQKIKKR